MGDFNGEAEDFSALKDILHNSWTDVGANAHIYGKPRHEGTCLGPNAAQPTRRDYIIANTQALRMIDDFQVLPQHLFPVHSFLRISLCIPVGCQTVEKCIMPTNLTETFNRFCSSLYTDEDSDNEKTRKRDSQLHKFHNILDCKLKRLADRLHGLLQHQDTDRYWALWNHTIEEAFCEQFVPNLADRKRCKDMFGICFGYCWDIFVIFLGYF